MTSKTVHNSRVRKTCYFVHVAHLLILKTDARMKDAHGRTHARIKTHGRTRAQRISPLHGGAAQCVQDLRQLDAVWWKFIAEKMLASTHTTLV